MTYTMHINVDGGCRGNGQTDAVAAAAAVFKDINGNVGQAWTRILPSNPRPTNQRAELTAVILGLEKALERYRGLHSYPHAKVTIYADSKYAVDCMTKWIHNWRGNGWLNAKGGLVVNRDLIEEAGDLDEELRQEGELNYVLIPRRENEDADRYCNEAMNERQ